MSLLVARKQGRGQAWRRMLVSADGGFEVVDTRGGARAMLDRAVGEVMHPVVGPRVESERLYVAPARLRERLAQTDSQPLVLLDVGLGAGSNAVAAWRVSEALPQSSRRLEIVSFEYRLESLRLALAPEHRAAFDLEGSAGDAAEELLRSHRHESARTTWRLSAGDVVTRLADEPSASADIVFWDMYSPRVDPASWSVAAFRELRRVCRAGATVHTYTGATANRSALLLAGFAVGFGEGSGAKQKHTTIAAACLGDLERPLDARWLDRLSRSSAPFPADAPVDALARISALAQFV
jgi:queuine tRNA-ribosyltransferase